MKKVLYILFHRSVVVGLSLLAQVVSLIVMVMLYAAAIFDVVGAGKLFAYYPTLHWEIRKWYVEAAGAVLLVLFLLLPVGTELFRKGGRTS